MSLSVDAVIAVSILRQMDQYGKASVEDVSRLLMLVPQYGIHMAEPAMRRVSGRVFSEDVAYFFSRCEIGRRYAQPLSSDMAVFTKEGLRHCRRILIEEYREDPEAVRALMHMMRT
jgi:hypothetical protein